MRTEELMRGRYVPLLLIPLLLATGQGRAWNKPGHMLSAAIAYKELPPATRSKVVQLLKKHPYYTASRWKKYMQQQNVPTQDQGLFLFMQAARWPDDARGTSYDHPAWHFIDFPYVPPGQPGSITGPPPPADNLINGFIANQGVVTNLSRTARDRAAALAWLFHLTGDVHQPLHTVSMFSTQYSGPEGDRGATRFYIRPSPGAGTVSLHSFWDNVLIGSTNQYRPVDQLAIQLRARPDLQRAMLPELTEYHLSKWAEAESFEIAKADAYKNGSLQGSTSKTSGIALPTGYPAAARSVADRRIVLAGYRLADLLQHWFP
jgi:hypothetical protein